MDIPRYKLVGYDHGAEPDHNGPWVRYSDVADLIAAQAALIEYYQKGGKTLAEVKAELGLKPPPEQTAMKNG